MKTSIAPWLSVSDAQEAVDYYKAAFGATERYALEDDSRRLIVARLAIGDAEFWLSEDIEAKPDGAFVRMILTVDDPDAVFTQALRAGATEIYPVSDEHGWHIGRLSDPFGHHWEVGKPLDKE